jgi:hypothetical protein
MPGWARLPRPSGPKETIPEPVILTQRFDLPRLADSLITLVAHHLELAEARNLSLTSRRVNKACRPRLWSSLQYRLPRALMHHHTRCTATDLPISHVAVYEKIANEARHNLKDIRLGYVRRLHLDIGTAPSEADIRVSSREDQINLARIDINDNAICVLRAVHSDLRELIIHHPPSRSSSTAFYRGLSDFTSLPRLTKLRLRYTAGDAYDHVKALLSLTTRLERLELLVIFGASGDMRYRESTLALPNIPIMPFLRVIEWTGHASVRPHPPILIEIIAQSPNLDILEAVQVYAPVPEIVIQHQRLRCLMWTGELGSSATRHFDPSHFRNLKTLMIPDDQFGHDLLAAESGRLQVS